MDILRPQVETEVRAEQQALDRLDVNKGVTEYTPHLQAVVAVVIEFTHWVLAVAHATHRTREGHAILFIYRQCRGHLQSILQRLAVHLVRVGDSGILADSHHLVHLETGVDTA